MSNSPDSKGTSRRPPELTSPHAVDAVHTLLGDLASSRSRRRADEAISRCYEPIKAEVIRSLRSKLFGCGLRFDTVDLEAFYNAAWMTMHTALSRGVITEASGGFLVVVAFCRAIDEARRVRPRLIADWADVARLEVSDDLAEALDNRASIRWYLEALKQALTVREREALVLCMLRGYTRPDAARVMDEPPKRMERIMDGAQLKLRPKIAAIKDGKWCANYESPLRAIAAGLLDKEGERYGMTIRHLRFCPACKGELRRLRRCAA